MNVKDKMRSAFAGLQGGLFQTVTKADVGSAYSELQKQGISLMGWADPFYPDPSIPDHLIKTAVKLLEEGFPSHYTMPIGNEKLKKAIAVKLKKENALNVDPLRNIIITPGSDSGLLYAMMPFINPGDEVMTPDPGYPSNFLNAELLGGVTVKIPLDEEKGFKLNVEEFEKRLTDRTKMVLITNPNNPTTTVFTRQELEQLARFIEKNDLICVVDQAFDATIFDEREMVSLASLDGMWERTLTVCSISKGMGLSGFRVGYIVAEDHIMDVLYGGAVNVLGATSTLSQMVAVEAFQNSDFIKEYNKKHDIRRKYAYETFNSIPGVSMQMPQSGFLCWIDVSHLGDSTELISYLIREARVACNDGKAYGENGVGHLRLVIGCYGENQESFAAMDRMKKALVKRAQERGMK